MPENFSELLLFYPVTESRLAESQRAQVLVLTIRTLCVTLSKSFTSQGLCV